MADHPHELEKETYGRCLTCTDRGLGRKVAMGPAPGEQQTLIAEPDRDPPAPTHLPAADAARLGAQLRRVIACMSDGEWHTLTEISAATGDPEASISARLRDMRRADCGGYTIDDRLRGTSRALHEYRASLLSAVSSSPQPEPMEGERDE